MVPPDCWGCEHAREVDGHAHLSCVRPDPAMTVDGHGARMGWAHYPALFDPVWLTKACARFEARPVGVPMRLLDGRTLGAA